MNDELNRENGGQPSPKLFSALLKAAAGKLGTDPETLRRSLESGSFEQSIRNAPAENEGMRKLKAALSDPETAKKLMKDPKAAEILRRAGRQGR